MKLERWSLSFYRLPYAREVRWANAIEREGLFALLELVADNGARGIAEGTIKASWQGVSPRSLAAALEDLVLPLVAPVDLADERAVAAALARLPENRLAKALVDNACWTLRAAARGVPLWKTWGGSGKVELSWTVTRDAPANMAADAARMCARHGFRALKVKGGQGVDTDLAALKEIRAAVGDEAALYVDANSAYPATEAAAYLRALQAAGVALAEDPAPLAPDAAFERLQQGSALPILVDSACSSSRDARLFLERGARALATKPGRVGLSETRAIEALATAAGASTTVGIYAESLLGTLISLQQPGSIPAEQTFYLAMTEQVTAFELPIRGGCVELPGVADLSNLVDRDRVRRLAYNI
ncbi:MAG: mandelate racemase/muconate lactonizing enzyme family protein [Burkholderiales bacterium]